MKIILCLIAITALLTGCGQNPAPQTKIAHWEYKIVMVENFEHAMRHFASAELRTNIDLGLQHLQQSDAAAGNFVLDTGNAEMNENNSGVDTYKLGNEGWELVSAVPQIETIPDAKFSVGRDYKPFVNIRTGKIILIFKRPK